MANTARAGVRNNRHWAEMLPIGAASVLSLYAEKLEIGMHAEDVKSKSFQPEKVFVMAFVRRFGKLPNDLAARRAIDECERRGWVSYEFQTLSSSRDLPLALTKIGVHECRRMNRPL